MNEIVRKKLDSILDNDVKDFRMLRLLEAYYDEYINGIGDNAEDHFPEELHLPLNERSSGILDAVNRLVELDVDLNEGDCFNPLMMSVAYADANMTRFLISHGADSNYWPDKEVIETSNYYYDDLDIAYMDEHWPISESYVKALENTARVLCFDGALGNYGGLCLLVDKENDLINFKQVQLKY